MMFQKLIKTVTLTSLLAVALGPQRLSANPSPIANVLCDRSEQMLTRLKTQFLVRRIWQGLRSPDQIFELWEDDQGDWTLVSVYAGGKMCILAMGSRLDGFSDLTQG